MIKSRIVHSVAVLLALGLISGCGPEAPEGQPVTGERAERLLERTLTAAEKERSPYRSTTEWVVAGTTVPDPGTSVSKNGNSTQPGEPDPYDSLRFLRGAGKSVSLEPDPENTNGRVLIVKPESEDWTARMKSLWQARIAALQTEGRALIEKQTSRLSGVQAEQLGRELASSLETARTKMERMAETLKADGTYRIKFNGRASLPQVMIIESILHYEADGRLREETVRTTYDFRSPPAP